MRAVFNTSPLIILTKLGYLSQAIGLFEGVIIPKAVWEEIRAKEDEVSAAIKGLTSGGAVRIVEPQNIKDLTYSGLHRGEIEAIALAKETSSIVVLDDLKARKAARFEGLRVIGTLGILKILMERKIIYENPDDLFYKLKRLGFRITPELFYRITGDDS